MGGHHKVGLGRSWAEKVAHSHQCKRSLIVPSSCLRVAHRAAWHWRWWMVDGAVCGACHWPAAPSTHSKSLSCCHSNCLLHSTPIVLLKVIFHRENKKDHKFSGIFACRKIADFVKRHLKSSCQVNNVLPCVIWDSFSRVLQCHTFLHVNFHHFEVGPPASAPAELTVLCGEDDECGTAWA